MRAAWGLALLLMGAPWLAAGANAQPAERVVVQFQTPLTAEHRAQLVAAGVTEFLEVLPAAVGRVTPLREHWLAQQPWVERIEHEKPLVPSLDLSTRLIRAGQPMLDLGYDGTGVTVAILDSGIDATHPDLQGRVLADVAWVNGQWVPTEADFDGHGTHVAGIVAGNGASSNGALRGVAPGASVVGMDFSQSFTTTTALQAFDWVLQNKDEYRIRVVTNSWGRADGGAWDPGDSLVRASNRLVTEGLVLLFSAGNHGPGASTISVEAQNPNVITVGAVDAAAQLAEFSGRGPVVDSQGTPQGWVKPDLVADGVGILSLRSAQATGVTPEAPTISPNQILPPIPGVDQGVGAEAARYVELSGTSQAAPHVAGIVAAMLQANPALTPGQVHNVLRETAIDLGAQGPDSATGFGLVDARDAMLRAGEAPPDHGNILLAGGEETYVSAGTLAGTDGKVVQTTPTVQVQDGGVVQAQVPVKPGATLLRFNLAASPATATFRVYLQLGGETLGPWTTATLEDGQRVISGEVEDPKPGVYRLTARPAAPVQASYTLTSTVTVRENAQSPAQLAERFRAPERPGALEQIQSELDYEAGKLGGQLRRALPGAEAVVIVPAAVAAALWRGSRRQRS